MLAACGSVAVHRAKHERQMAFLAACAALDVKPDFDDLAKLAAHCESTTDVLAAVERMRDHCRVARKGGNEPETKSVVMAGLEA